MSSLLRFVSQVERRIVPAALSAAGVTILAAGILAYVPPPGASPSPSPLDGAVVESPSASPGAGSTMPGGDASFSPPIPGETPTPSPSGAAANATRIVIPALGIDLPIIAGKNDRTVTLASGAKASFPYCDVAEYTDGMGQPGDPGVTYLYAHARQGMFLPLLAASQVDNGKGMLGYTVLVYTDDSKVYWYTITKVKRHVDPRDFSLVDGAPKDGQSLILQTSETAGTEQWPPKLQVFATFSLVQDATKADSHPKAKPVACS